MATPVKMPELGESITEGTITRWLKEEGDQVEADEPLFEVSTDKVDTEVPSPVAGVLKAIKVQADETVEVGAELAIIDQDADGPAGDASEKSAEDEPKAEAEGDQQQEEAGGEQQAEESEEAAEEGSEEAGTEEERESEAAEAGDGEEQAEEPEEKPKAEGSGGGKTTTVTMPELGESITEGTITRWLKQEGDQVEADEALFEVSTDKVDTEVPSPVAGVLQSIKVQADETVEVGAELAVIGGGDGAEAGPSQEEPEKQTPKEKSAEQGAGAEAEQAGEAEAEEEPEEPAAEDKPKQGKAARAGGNGKGNGKAAAGVSPLVRRLAREHDVDLSQVEGSGSGGRIRREDVDAFVQQRGEQPAAKPAAAAAPADKGEGKAKPAAAAGPKVAVPLAKGLREELVPATRLRKVIAERMVASLQTSAQLTSAVEVDMTNIMRLRARAKDDFKQREGASLSPMPFAVLALIAAIKEYPTVNSAMDEDGNLHVYQDVHLGVAVDTP
ncbi:MAG TPA: biotin/lipoyl-containing protein, partial [Actinomycetes bacterium]|nr:biotin/lipoyl-containing protein [Actinomycetes bacterium]